VFQRAQMDILANNLQIYAYRIVLLCFLMIQPTCVSLHVQLERLQTRIQMYAKENANMESLCKTRCVKLNACLDHLLITWLGHAYQGAPLIRLLLPIPFRKNVSLCVLQIIMVTFKIKHACFPAQVDCSKNRH